MPSFCASNLSQWLTRCQAMSVPRSFEKSTGSMPLPSLSLALCGLCRLRNSGEEPADCVTCLALAGRCFGDLFDGGGCGLVCRSRDLALCSVSSVWASRFMKRELGRDRQTGTAPHQASCNKLLHSILFTKPRRRSAAVAAVAAGSAPPLPGTYSRRRSATNSNPVGFSNHIAALLEQRFSCFLLQPWPGGLINTNVQQ